MSDLTREDPVSRLAEAVSDSLAATTEGTDYAQAPVPSDEPGSPYVMRLTNELIARGVAASPADGAGVDAERLANIIREVDGGHDLGAAELAERIIAHPSFEQRMDAHLANVERVATEALAALEGASDV